MREFLHVDDLTEAIFFLMNKINAKDIYKKGVSHINIGSGEEITIKQLSFLIKKIVGYNGEICFDQSKPDGTPRKLLDSSIINNLGWSSKISLEEGLKELYAWYEIRHT